VQSKLTGPRSSTSKSQPLRVEPSSLYDSMSWQNQPMQMYADVESAHELPGGMHPSLLATSPSDLSMYMEGKHAQTEKQETGSDASTADTSPYYADEAFYMAHMDFHDMAWHGQQYLAPDVSPYFSDFAAPFLDESLHQHSWEQQAWEQQGGWSDFGQSHNASQPEFMSASIGAARDSTMSPAGVSAVPTSGSSRHRQGTCKPCAFAFKPEGCQSGAECKFCHLCPPGEKQRRKRVMRQLQRNLGIFEQ